MGNRKNKLSWSWSLISLEWIPEILASFDNLIESSWVGLQRQMTVHAVNQSFSNMLFNQLKSVLCETGLVIEDGKYRKSCSGNQ